MLAWKLAVFMVLVCSPREFKAFYVSRSTKLRQQYFDKNDCIMLKDTKTECNTPISSVLNSVCRKILKGIGVALLLPTMYFSYPSLTSADDELAKYAAEGNRVEVDGQCFFKKCALETSACANDPSCLKGLSCLARLADISHLPRHYLHYV